MSERAKSLRVNRASLSLSLSLSLFLVWSLAVRDIFLLAVAFRARLSLRPALLVILCAFNYVRVF